MLKGYSTIIYPVSRTNSSLPRGDPATVQWHALHSEKRQPSVRKILSKMPKRLSTEDVNNLLNNWNKDWTSHCQAVSMQRLHRRAARLKITKLDEFESLAGCRTILGYYRSVHVCLGRQVEIKDCHPANVQQLDQAFPGPKSKWQVQSVSMSINASKIAGARWARDYVGPDQNKEH